MRAYEILLEYDHRKTLLNFGSELANRMMGYEQEKDVPADVDLDTYEGGGYHVDLDDRRGRDLLGLNPRAHDTVTGTKILDWFEQNDPTEGKFVIPMIRWYLSGEMRSLEDAPKLKGPIATFVKFRNRIKGVNLKKIGFREFIEIMMAQEDTLSNAEVDREQEQGFYDRNEATLIYNEPDMKIVIPKTMAASCYFGRNTQWCTSARDKNDNMFSAYVSDGPLFIILDKPKNKRWQFHFDLGGGFVLRQVSHQFMDETDSEVQPYDVLNGKPMQAIREWAREVGFDPLLAAMNNYDEEESDARGSEGTSYEDEPDEEEDDGQLSLDLGDRRAA